MQKLFRFFHRKWSFADLRKKAYELRKVVVKKRGVSIVDRRLKLIIKEYSKQRFGTTAYWPYLALYTEIRGEFLDGWLPFDYYKLVMLPKICPAPALYLNDQKTYDYRLFNDFALKPLFIYILGIFYNPDLEIVENDQLLQFMKNYDDLIVIKEDGGRAGEQVRIIQSSKFSTKELNGSKNYVIQPYVKQYKVLNALYPGSVNTFRVATYLEKNGSVIVKFVFLRFGSDGLKFDNLAAGGDYLFFDLTGKPSNLIYDKLGFEKGDRHKNTGFLFSDVKIPKFQEMLEKCKHSHKKYPYVRLIGWDVCIDSSGVLIPYTNITTKQNILIPLF